MQTLLVILLIFLLLCAVSVSITKDLLMSVIIYMSFSTVMTLVWIIIQSPDLAITEAAVGAGITSILFFVTLKKIHAIDLEFSENDDMSDGDELNKNELNKEVKEDAKHE